jgi:Tfp pilus assembly protein PilO
MKQEKLANLIGLYALIGIVAAVVLTMFVIKPAFDKAQKLGEEKALVDVKIASLERLKADTETLRQNYNAKDSKGQTVKDRRDRILALLPVKTEEERLLALLSNLATQSGVVLQSFGPDTTVVGGGAVGTGTSSLVVYSAAVSINGSFDKVQNFLTRLENSARFVDVRGLSIAAGAASANSAGVLEVRVPLSAYYQAAAPVTQGAQ